VVCRVENRAQLLLAELLGHLDHDHDWLDTGPRLADNAADGGRLSLQCLRRGHGEHDLTRRWRIEPALGVGRTGLDDYVSAGHARERISGELTIDGTASRQLKDEFRLLGHPPTLAPGAEPEAESPMTAGFTGGPGCSRRSHHRAAGREGAEQLIDLALREGWSLDAESITCPVRIVWGTDDRLLPWPSAAARYRNDWLPHAEWIVLDGVGHCPPLDIPLETAQLILGVTSH
jgi:pimeloyl-ACP methyl ester carboxylesterase